MADLLVVKNDESLNPQLLNYYDTLVYDKDAEIIAYKRMKPVVKRKIFQSDELSYPATNKEFIHLFEDDSLQKFVHQNIQVSLSAYLETYQYQNTLQLIVNTFDTLGQLKRYHVYEFETNYLGKKIDERFLHNYLIEDIEEGETKLSLSIWNKNKEKVKLTRSKCTLFEIKATEK